MEKKKITWLCLIVVIIVVLIGIFVGYELHKKVIKSNDKSKESQELVEPNTNDLEKNLGIEFPANIKETIKSQDGKIIGYIICNIMEEQCEENTTYYYTISNKMKTKLYNEINYLGNKYVAAFYEDSKLDILSIETGYLVKSFNYYIDNIEQKIFNNNEYYIISTSPAFFAYTILDSEFNPIINEIETYLYLINKDNTITIIPSKEYFKYNSYCNQELPSKFYIYNLNGNKIYESKEYDYVISIGIDSNTSLANGKLLVQDNGNITIIDNRDNIIKALMKGNACNIADDPLHIINDDEYHFDIFTYNDGNLKSIKTYTYNLKSEKLELYYEENY